MNETVKNTKEWALSPLRTLDDFLLESARFQIPNVKDMEKWGNRVVQNLLYYQTNYFLMSVVIFLLVGVFHPVDMICGMLSVLVAFGLFFIITNTTRSAVQFKKNHPFLSVMLILGGGYFITVGISSIMVFLFGILLPFSVTFIHASMRLRNLKNKLVNKIEIIGLKRSPMGLILEAFGMDPILI